MRHVPEECRHSRVWFLFVVWPHTLRAASRFSCSIVGDKSANNKKTFHSRCRATGAEKKKKLSISCPIVDQVTHKSHTDSNYTIVESISQRPMVFIDLSFWPAATATQLLPIDEINKAHTRYTGSGSREIWHFIIKFFSICMSSAVTRAQSPHIFVICDLIY